MDTGKKNSAGIKSLLAVAVVAACCLLCIYCGYIFLNVSFFTGTLKTMLLICDAVFILGVTLLGKRYIDSIGAGENEREKSE